MHRETKMFDKKNLIGKRPPVFGNSMLRLEDNIQMELRVE
jgi:hypothetical protein